MPGYFPATGDVYKRQLQLLGDGDDDAALGSTVQLGQDDARQSRRLFEGPRCV